MIRTVVLAAAVPVVTAVAALTALTGCEAPTPSADASLSARALPTAASPGCQRQPDVPTGSTSVQTVESGGQARTYWIHLPAGFQPARPTPLALAFHGRKGTGSDIEAFSGIDALDAIAVYPRGLPGPDGETAWQGAPENSGADDVRFVNTLLDRLEDTLCVDQSRIFATGKSEGGGFTALLACRLPDRIAAFATVSGAFYRSTDCTASPPVPIVVSTAPGTT